MIFLGFLTAYAFYLFMEFKVVIQKDREDGGYIASCPALPGCHSQGETLAEVRKNIKDAILGCIEALNSRAHARSRSERIVVVAV